MNYSESSLEQNSMRVNGALEVDDGASDGSAASAVVGDRSRMWDRIEAELIEYGERAIRDFKNKYEEKLERERVRQEEIWRRREVLFDQKCKKLRMWAINPYMKLEWTEEEENISRTVDKQMREEEEEMRRRTKQHENEFKNDSDQRSYEKRMDDENSVKDNAEFENDPGEKGEDSQRHSIFRSQVITLEDVALKMENVGYPVEKEEEPMVAKVLSEVSVLDLVMHPDISDSQSQQLKEIVMQVLFTSKGEDMTSRKDENTREVLEEMSEGYPVPRVEEVWSMKEVEKKNGNKPVYNGQYYRTEEKTSQESTVMQGEKDGSKRLQLYSMDTIILSSDSEDTENKSDERFQVQKETLVNSRKTLKLLKKKGNWTKVRKKKVDGRELKLYPVARLADMIRRGRDISIPKAGDSRFVEQIRFKEGCRDTIKILSGKEVEEHLAVENRMAGNAQNDYTLESDDLELLD